MDLHVLRVQDYNFVKYMIEKFQEFLVDVTHGILHTKLESTLVFVIAILIVILTLSIIIKSVS